MALIVDGGTPADVGTVTADVNMSDLMPSIVRALGSNQAYTYVFAQQSCFRPFVQEMIESAAAIKASE